VSALPDISLPRFQGPLDLLLELVRKHEVEIADIPIAAITRQYLEYLRQAEALKIDLGSEFVHTAALLIHIKSRCLLASDPAIAAGEEDPRQELVRQLMEHQEVQAGAEFLRQKLELAGAAWSRPGQEEFASSPAEEPPDPTGAVNLLQVLRLAQQALAAARTYSIVMPDDSVSVEEMGRWLEQRIASRRDRIEAGALLSEQPDPSHRSALFLAILEMANSGRIQLEQQECFGPIAISQKSDMAQPCPNVYG
jgi:segregation and condensation protein A